jgi:tRNA1(Val) A37 N6-methylase TrmN6
MNETEGKVIKRGTNTGTMEELLTLEKGKIFFETKNGTIRIINDDFLTTNLIEANSVDLIVTSPPYNVDIHYNSSEECLEMMYLSLYLSLCYCKK